MKERGTKIVHNRIRCKLCGEVLESTNRHDFVPCKCFKESGGIKGCACDGGLSYFRWVGNPNDYENLSETRLFTDEEVDEYNERQKMMAKDYGDLFKFELMEK